MVGCATLLLCFSIGLDQVTVGIDAALSLKQATTRWSGLNTFAQRASYFSSAPRATVSIYMGVHGWMGIIG
ncbi:sulfite exporter TauE/SafE family protein [Erwinia billingiae]|uniref:hypothetical protein n=1 Tax=Erwinia billingiae TaxID=182337 RepID=UPI002AF6BC28|nr:hypothetical protein [Erwinia billingiae]MCX0498564.1 hypothetical protein [Erwinia billingiae]